MMESYTRGVNVVMVIRGKVDFVGRQSIRLSVTGLWFGLNSERYSSTFLPPKWNMAGGGFGHNS